MSVEESLIAHSVKVSFFSEVKDVCTGQPRCLFPNEQKNVCVI
jgi:hypothetical protein